MTAGKRYIRRNPADYVLLVILGALIVGVLARALFLQFSPVVAEPCSAELSFVLRGADRDTVRHLEQSGPVYAFHFSDGTALEDARLRSITPTKQILQSEDGTYTETDSALYYDITFSVAQAEGTRAKDGTFLLSGVRRLATADRVTLALSDARYTVEFISVRIQS